MLSEKYSLNLFLKNSLYNVSSLYLVNFDKFNLLISGFKVMKHCFKSINKISVWYVLTEVKIS